MLMLTGSIYSLLLRYSLV